MPDLDVTDVFAHYRRACWTLWNTGVWSVPELRNGTTALATEELISGLADLLIIERLLQLEPDRFEAPDDPAMRPGARFRAYPFYVRPADWDIQLMLESREQTGLWLPPQSFAATGLSLRLSDLWDFGNMRFREFRYYAVEVEVCEGSPDEVGRRALAEIESSRVVLRTS
ncbi:MAG: hypothetical protein H6509_06340 [Bryobacterales bacterium]|nr:hypothetical protein [Bryobacterales bacterium]